MFNSLFENNIHKYIVIIYCNTFVEHLKSIFKKIKKDLMPKKEH